MPFTYTYTARNKDNPNRVITFTIFEDYLKVNLTGLFDQVSDVVENADHQTAVKDFLSTQSGSALFKVVERLSGPVHVNDVSPGFENGEIKLTFWKRVAGLRFAPLTLSMGEVDNTESASQFIETLEERQDQSETPSIFSGPLDYWVTWIGLLAGLVILIKWPRKKNT